MRILFLTHSFHPLVGGIETMSGVLAEYFSQAGHNVRLVTWTHSQQPNGFPFTVIRKPSLSVLLNEHRQADLVFENNPSLRLSFPQVIFKKPHVVVLHTYVSRTDGAQGLQDLLKKYWLKRASKVIACNKSVSRQSFPQALVIPNPFQDHLFQRLPAIAKNKHFIFLGRLVSDKGCAVALEAFGRLIAAMRADGKPADYTFTIVGDGPELAALTQLALDLQVAHLVQFTGILKGRQLVECLNQHQCIVVPSVWAEPFGLVALEGMACGCLPIVSNRGGLPDAVGNCGLLFDPGQIPQLVECMKRALLDADLQRGFWSCAQEHLQQHTVNAIASQYLAAVEQLVKINGN